MSIPIAGTLGDQQASLFGHGCFAESQIKATYGTGAFIWLNAGNCADLTAPDGLLRTIAWRLDRPSYALEGFVMSAGAAFEWLAPRLAVAGGGMGVVERAQQLGTSGGVILVPCRRLSRLSLQRIPRLTRPMPRMSTPTASSTAPT
jgi:glycerol kinase